MSCRRQFHFNDNNPLNFENKIKTTFLISRVTSKMCGIECAEAQMAQVRLIIPTGNTFHLSFFAGEAKNPFGSPALWGHKSQDQATI